MLSSSSTFADINAAYDDNASYAESNSPAKAKAFVTACRMLLRRLPKMTVMNNDHTQLNPDLIQKEIDKAQIWLEANDTGANPAGGPRFTRASFENFRN